MKKALISAALLGLSQLSFADVSDIETIPETPQLIINVGEEIYSRDEPVTLEESLELNRKLTDLLNQLIVEYIAYSDENKSKVDSILASDEKIVREVKNTIGEVEKIKPVKIEPPKNIYIGGYFLTNPFSKLGGSNVSAGVELGFNLFNTIVVSPGLGLETDDNNARLQVKLSIAYWMF